MPAVVLPRDALGHFPSGWFGLRGLDGGADPPLQRPLQGPLAGPGPPGRAAVTHRLPKPRATEPRATCGPSERNLTNTAPLELGIQKGNWEIK